jgi:hypothetical protein
MGLIMSDEQKQIEWVLEGLREIHTGLNKDIEYLIESGICDEDDLEDTKATINKMYKLNRDIQDLLVGVLSDEYDSKQVKRELLKQSTMRALQRDTTDKKSMVEWFVKERLGNGNG